MDSDSEKRYQKLRKEIKDIRKELKKSCKKVKEIQKQLAKIQFRDLIEAYRVSLVKTFAEFIQSGNTQDDSPNARIKYWLKRDRMHDFFCKLIKEVKSGGNTRIRAKLNEITADENEFLKTLEICSFDLKKQYRNIAHSLDIINSGLERQEFDKESAKRAAANLSGDVAESAVKIVEFLGDKGMIWPTESHPVDETPMRKK